MFELISKLVELYFCFMLWAILFIVALWVVIISMTLLYSVWEYLNNLAERLANYLYNRKDVE